MKSNLLIDEQDTSGSFFNAAGDGIFASFLPPVVYGGGSPFASGSPVIAATPTPPAEAVQAEIASAASGSGGTGSVVAETSSSGFTVNLEFDAAAMAAPASFRAGIEQAASILAATITNRITVNIGIDYSGTGGGAAAGPDNGEYLSYSTVRADLVAGALPGDSTFNALPAGSTIQGQSQVAVWNAQLKAFGLLPANSTTTDDGSATFATDINSNLLVGVALHELTHAMGRVPYGPQPDIFDLFRFTSVGTRLFSDSIPSSAAYFSVDGGTTKIADYGRTSDPSDFLNAGVQGGNDPFNEYYSGSTLQGLTTSDKEQLDALGFNLASQTSQSIVAAAATSEAVQGGAATTLLSGPPVITDSASATLSSVTIKIANAGGSAVAGDELYVNGVQNGSVGSGVTASWNASTDTLTLTGSATVAVYETLLSAVTYQDTGTDSSTGSHPERTVTWSVNDGTQNFSTTSQIEIDRAPVVTVANVVLGTISTAVAASSLLTATDLDGDAITTYALKDTGNGHFALNGVAQANNQEIDVTAAQLSQLTYQSTGGVDSLQVRANDGTTWSAWEGFTVTGPTTIQTDTNSLGTTSLVQVGSNYFLKSPGTGTGAELQAAGAGVIAGQYGAWIPIGAVLTSTGYDVAWKDTATDQFVVWSTDSTGLHTSNIVDVVSSTNPALESIETTFHQDLNGDGVIGVPAASTLIQTDTNSLGTISLVQVGNNYFLESPGTGTGPELQAAGAAVVAGQYGAWIPIGAVLTSTGYDVAWKDTATDQFVVWSTDNTGLHTSNIVDVVSATDPALESIETTFEQDLNGDGTIGVPASKTAGFEAVSVPASTHLALSQAIGPSGAATIGAGATLELAAADSGSVTFGGPTGTLIVDHSSSFSAQVLNLTGNGNLSGSDQIDLKDIAFGTGTTVGYAGTVSGGILTISDAQNHTAQISLAGDYTDSTFSLSSDGQGGTVVIDPPGKQDAAGGTLSFSEPNPTDSHTVSVSPQNGGAGYIGNFSVDAATTADGQDSVGWHFNFDVTAVAATVTQSYDVTVANNPANGANSTVTQSVSVTIAGPGNDSFVFHPGVGSEVVVNAASTDSIELDGFSAVTNSHQLAVLLSAAQAGQAQSLFQSANGGNDTVINLGDHDSITLQNVHLADLHASNFIIN